MTHRKVRDVMTTQVRNVYLGSPVKLIADELDAGRISAMPVLDDEANVVGVVSEADLLHKITYQDDTEEWPRLFRRHRVDRAKAEGLAARDLMTAPAVTISPNASVVEAALLMEQRHIKRLPVVNDLGSLVGIVSRGDLVRLFLRSDEEIRSEVQEEVLDRALLLSSGSASVWVANGIPTLRGRLKRRSDTQLAAELARRVDGVVDVVNELAWEEDDTTADAVRAQMKARQSRSTT